MPKPTYLEYLQYCQNRGLRAMPEPTFKAICKAGYNPFTTSWS